MRVVLEGTEAEVACKAVALLRSLLSAGARIGGLRLAVEALMRDGQTRRLTEIVHAVAPAAADVGPARSAAGHLLRRGVLIRPSYGVYVLASSAPVEPSPQGPADEIRRLMADERRAASSSSRERSTCRSTRPRARVTG